MHMLRKFWKSKPKYEDELSFKKYYYQEKEAEYPPWMSQKRLCLWVMSLHESMPWNFVLAALTLLSIVILSLDYESTEIIFGVRLSIMIDIAYNVMYFIHVVALVLDSCYRRIREKRRFSRLHWFCFLLDAATYLHYLKVFIGKSVGFDFPYVITIVCYYLRLRRSIMFLMGLSSYYLKGSIVGLGLKYWYIFLMLRVIYSNAFVWLGLTEEITYKFLPPTLNKSRGKLFFRAFYMMDKKFLPIGMDRPANSDLNRVASMVVVVSGSLLVTGVSIASLALFISVYMKSEQCFRARFRLITDYMTVTHVPSSLREKIKTFYKMYWHKQKAVSVTHLLPAYPPPLLSSVNMDIFFEALQKSQILRDLSYVFLSEVVKYMKTIHYVPGDVIIERNTMKAFIVYISYGDVEIVTAEDDETPILRFTRGTILNPCGACVDVACTLAHVSVRAATFCTAHVLRTADLWRVAVKHGDLNGQTYIIHSALDEHLNKVIRHYEQRPRQPIKYKSTIQQLKRNLIELKEARDKDGELLMNRSDIFLQIANCYIMRNLMILQGSDAICLRSTFPCILQPSSDLQMLWRTFVAIITLIVTIVHPYHIILTQSSSLSFVFFNFIVTVIFILDIIVYLSTGTKIEEGVPVTFMQTSSRQMRSLWFVLDVLAVIPMFEFIGDGHFAGMNKLCKIPYVFRTLKFVQETSRFFGGALCLISFCLLLMIVNWLVAALDHGFLCFKLNFCRIVNFLDSDAWEFNKTAKSDSEIVDLILYSNFWSINFITFASHLTALGSMVHFPTQAEIMAILEFCALMYIFVQAAYAAHIMVTELLSDKYEACIQRVQKFLKRNNIDLALQERFINYLQLCWFTNKAYRLTHKERSILHDLPQHVYHDVMAVERNKFLMYIPFMKELPPEILKVMSLRANIFYTAPNEILLHTGDICNEIYVIKQGFCEVINPDTKVVVDVITSKTHFGVIECLLRVPAFYTVKAVTHVELYSISRKDIGRVINMPKIKYTIRAVKKEPEYRELVTKRRMQFLTYEKPPLPVSRLKFPQPRKHETDAAFLKPFQNLGFCSILRYVFPRFTLHPDGTYLRCHECFRAACAFASAILTPACYLLTMHYGTWFYTLAWILDFTAYFDMLQRMLVAYYDEKGILVYHPASTAAHYVKGALLVDLLACMPFEVMDDVSFEYMNDSYRTVPRSMECFMFNRCLQLYRLPCALAMLDQYVKRRDILYSIKVLPMFIVLISAVGTLISIFSVNKVLFKRARYKGILDIPKTRFTSWIYYNATNVGYNITTPFNLWLTSNYWATSQLTFTGLGLFLPHTTTLLVIFILGMLAAKVLLICLSVRVMSLRSNVNDALALFKQNMKDMVTFMKREKFPKDLQKEVVTLYNYTWSRNQGTDCRSVVKLCDQITLRTDAILHIYGHIFRMCPILPQSDISLLRLLGRAMSSVYCCENMRVVERSDVISDLYFVDYGTVLVSDSDDDDWNIESLSCGSIFGNLHNIDQEICSNNFTAGTDVHLLQINSRLFYNILEDFPDVRAGLHRLEDQNYIASREPSKVALKYKSSNLFMRMERNWLTKYLHKHSCIVYIYLIAVSLACVFLDVYIAGFIHHTKISLVELYMLDIAFAVKFLIYILFPYIADPRIDTTLAMKKAKRRYIKGTFKYDVLSILPTELLCLCFSDPWRWFPYFRLNRCFRVVTVHKCLKLWRVFNIDTTFHIIAGLAIWFALGIHITTCFWYYLAEVQDRRKPHSSWRWNKMLGDKGNTSSTVCYNSQYICAMYFIVITFLQNGGVNDILPKQHIEVMFICALMIVSTIVCMVYVGEFCNVFHYYSWRCLNFYYYFLELQEFLKNNRVSRALVKQTMKYSVYLWREARGRQMPLFVNAAPECMRLKIMSAAYMKHLQTAEVFKYCEPAFLRQLVGHFQPYYYDENMYVVREGEITNSMYFIHRGRVREFNEGLQEEGQVFKTGWHFGLIHGLYHNVRYTHSYKADIKSQVLTLSLDKWEYLLRHFPVNIKNIYNGITDPRTRDEFKIEQTGTVRMFSPKPLMNAEVKSKNADKTSDILDDNALTDAAGTNEDVPKNNESQDTHRLLKELKDKVRKLYLETMIAKEATELNEASVLAETNKNEDNVAESSRPVVKDDISKTQTLPTPHSTNMAFTDSGVEIMHKSKMGSKLDHKKLHVKESKVFFKEKRQTIEDIQYNADDSSVSKEKTSSKTLPKDDTFKKQDLVSVPPSIDSVPAKTEVKETPRSEKMEHDILISSYKSETPASTSIAEEKLSPNSMLINQKRTLDDNKSIKSREIKRENNEKPTSISNQPTPVDSVPLGGVGDKTPMSSSNRRKSTAFGDDRDIISTKESQKSERVEESEIHNILLDSYKNETPASTSVAVEKLSPNPMHTSLLPSNDKFSKKSGESKMKPISISDQRKPVDGFPPDAVVEKIPISSFDRRKSTVFGVDKETPKSNQIEESEIHSIFLGSYKRGTPESTSIAVQKLSPNSMPTSSLPSDNNTSIKAREIEMKLKSIIDQRRPDNIQDTLTIQENVSTGQTGSKVSTLSTDTSHKEKYLPPKTPVDGIPSGEVVIKVPISSSDRNKSSVLGLEKDVINSKISPKSEQIRESEIREIVSAGEKSATPTSVRIPAEELSQQKHASLMPLEDNIPIEAREVQKKQTSVSNQLKSDVQDTLIIQENPKKSSKVNTLTSVVDIPKKKYLPSGMPVDGIPSGATVIRVPTSSSSKRKSRALGFDDDVIKKELDTLKNDNDIPSNSKEYRTTRSSLEEIELKTVSYDKEDSKKEFVKPSKSLNRELKAKSNVNLFAAEDRDDDSPTLTKVKAATSVIKNMDTQDIPNQGAQYMQEKRSDSTKQTNLETPEMQHQSLNEQRSTRLTLPKPKSFTTTNAEDNKLTSSKDSGDEEKKQAVRKTGSVSSVDDVEEYIKKKKDKKSKKKK